MGRDVDPYRALLGQGFALTLLFFVSAGEGNELLRRIDVILIVVLVAVSGWCLGHYVISTRKVGAVRPDRWRTGGDSLVIAEVVVPTAVGICTLRFVHDSIGISTKSLISQVEVATLATGVAAILTAVLASSAIDWWYIRPRRDGLVVAPPCVTPGHVHWTRITKTWLRHRFLTETAFIVLLPMTTIAMTIEVYTQDPVSHQWITKIISPLFFLASFPWKYSKERFSVGMRAVNQNPPFALGDTITWRTTGDLRAKSLGHWIVRGLTFRVSVKVDRKRTKERGVLLKGQNQYVFDVALDNATLLKANGKRSATGFPRGYVAPTAALMAPGGIHKRDEIAYCASGCRRLNPHCARLDATNPAEITK